jgi:hypothetical protein
MKTIALLFVCLFVWVETLTPQNASSTKADTTKPVSTAKTIDQSLVKKDLTKVTVTKMDPKLDTDGDGILDILDTSCVTVPGKPGDSDNDGWPDSLERRDLICVPCDSTCKGSCNPVTDTDGDGVVNGDDKCPCEKARGCPGGCLKPGPDPDQDGIPNQDDECPCQNGPKCNRGCPSIDRDCDGISDKEDRCPDLFGVKSGKGCPDQDHDGIPDHEDDCRNVFGTLTDSDNDGIPNSRDLCNCEPSRTACGCPEDRLPEGDSDKDGIQNYKDDCVCAKIGSAACPDRDGDGVPDSADRCPLVAGKKSNHGCPNN